MRKLYRHPETKKIISKTVYDQLTALEARKVELDKQARTLAIQKAQIDTRLAEIAKNEGLDIPDIVREVVKGLLAPIIRQFGFKAEELQIIKPTPSDPIVRYRGEIICWYLISK